ncbi:hypothetical protein COHA_003511 [Chlorella ohadii]|uniref:Uncharacterized protein n=1 Tax=Chlorella ohadii TaxID=2649997 RepID=A0AAD5H6L3_9CHLO|nr:hypothetical protein COHA_003511 [Chlorella ohadii]
MVLIHGCGPGSKAFFPADPVHCPECQGFPEYLAQTKQALARGYHVLALQASNEASGCWSSTTNNGNQDDRIMVVDTVQQFLANHSMAGKPVYFQGYSSGGTMSLKLPRYILDEGKDLRIDGIIPTDAAPRGGFNAEGSDGKLKKGLDYPPVIYVAMQAGGSRERAPAQIEFLRNNDVPADLIVSYPRQVTPTFFSDRVPTISPEQSQELVAALTQLGGLNATGYTVPGVWVLPTAVQQLPWLADGLVQGAVVQQLRIAAGDHENMGEFTGAALAWLESGGKADVATLFKELVPAQPALLTIERLPEGGQAPAAAPTSGA